MEPSTRKLTAARAYQLHLLAAKFYEQQPGGAIVETLLKDKKEQLSVLKELLAPVKALKNPRQSSATLALSRIPNQDRALDDCQSQITTWVQRPELFYETVASWNHATDISRARCILTVIDQMKDLTQRNVIYNINTVSLYQCYRQYYDVNNVLEPTVLQLLDDASLSHTYKDDLSEVLRDGHTRQSFCQKLCNHARSLDPSISVGTSFGILLMSILPLSIWVKNGGRLGAAGLRSVIVDLCDRGIPKWCEENQANTLAASLLTKSREIFWGGDAPVENTQKRKRRGDVGKVRKRRPGKKLSTNMQTEKTAEAAAHGPDPEAIGTSASTPIGRTRETIENISREPDDDDRPAEASVITSNRDHTHNVPTPNLELNSWVSANGEPAVVFGNTDDNVLTPNNLIPFDFTNWEGLGILSPSKLDALFGQDTDMDMLLRADSVEAPACSGDPEQSPPNETPYDAPTDHSDQSQSFRVARS